MTEKLVSIFIDFFGTGMSKEILVFVVSLFPILELRGGILAAYALGIGLLPAFAISYIGNILPIPFILVLIDKVFAIMRKTPLKSIPTFFENKALNKKETIEKYGYWGLLIFVGIPLPGTGAWTGALLAVLLNMNKKKAFVFIMGGVLMAGIIMSIFSFGLLNLLGIG